MKLRKLVVYPSGSLDICNDNEDPDNNGAVEIILKGSGDTTTDFINNKYGDRSIVIRGEVKFCRPTKRTLFTRLLQTATTNTNEITIPSNVDWTVGDELVIAST